MEVLEKGNWQETGKVSKYSHRSVSFSGLFVQLAVMFLW